ncbi:hypothetical protein QZH41_000562 [Actinostola sp. cb2023]|nr:hypothetical protein QZH41_000562 [Actinostola sp. cb2023]
MEAKAYEDKTLPIVAIVDTTKYCSIGAESGVGDKVGGTLNELFKGNLMDGLKQGLTVALDEFLGNAKAGRQEMTQFHVAFDSNSLLRIDVYFYKYEFHSEGLKKHGRNMFCYVAQVGVLDCIKIDPQVTLYELTKSVGPENIQDAKKLLEDETTFAVSLYKDIRRLSKASRGEEPAQ